MSYTKSQMKGQRESKPKRNRTVAGWVVCPSDILSHFIVTITSAGHAVLLAGSEGDNMLSVTVYSDGDKDKYYIRPSDNIPDTLSEIVDNHCSPRVVEAFEAFLDAVLGKDTQSPGKTPKQD